MDMRNGRSVEPTLSTAVAKPAVVICLSLTLITFGCRKGDRTPVIAVLNGHDIHRAEYERFVQLKIGEFTNQESSDSVRSEMLDEYLERRLVLDEASKAGLAVSDSEIDEAAQENTQVKSTASTAGAREELAADLLMKKFYQQVVLRDVQVGRDEIQRYMEENQSRLAERPGFYVREIRVQSREAADRLRRELGEGSLDFAAAARVSSEAPNAELGGLTRYDEGQLPEVLERAIRPLRPGEISAVIRSSFGYHIFKLERRIQPNAFQERRSRLNDGHGQLAEELIARKNQEVVDQWLGQMMSSAKIRIDGSALGFTYVGRLRHN
jgi:parvulin-like peptidyl-prolyl isomerase